MSLYTQLQEDRKVAFKAKETIKKDILNFIIAQIKQKHIDERRELSDDEIIKLIQKEIKTRQEAINFLEQNNQSEEVVREKERIAILEAYLPDMLTEEALFTLVKKYIEEQGILEPMKARGQIIGPIMQEYGARVDGALLNRIITTYVSGD